MEIWMRLLEANDNYLSTIEKSKNESEHAKIKMINDISNIQQMLCSLNLKASYLGPSISFTSRLLTNRLKEAYSFETKEIGIKNFIDSNLKIKNKCNIE